MPDHPGISLIVGFASDMGSAEYLAELFTTATKDVGIDVDEIELNDIAPADLRAATHFVVITSTFGDGELPDNGAVFWESLCAAHRHRLDHLSYAVLALGDRGYDQFCHAGRIIDERLEALGATRLVDRVDCDVDYEGDAAAWTADVVKLLDDANAAGSQVRPIVVAAPAERPQHSPWDRNCPYSARMVANRLLTAPESDKEVRHYEIDLTDSGISYRAGDSIAVHPVNDPELVAAIMTRLGVGPDHQVAGHGRPIVELLAHHLEIRTPSRALQMLVAARTRDTRAAAVLAGLDSGALSAWLYDRDVLDLLELADLGADEVVDTLRPLQFRDYSIASSPLVHPNRVHLTVATVRYTARGRVRGGAASTQLAERGDAVRVHPRPNHAFRLPGPDVPIIMIGPGTGIAPFRGFLQERQATGAPGKSWLFFGNRRRATDFLYGDELDGFLNTGVLTRLDLAFSRDCRGRGPKEYVQRRMRQHAAQLFAWLEDGAHLYVCGDADRMARDVDRALHDIIADAGRLDAAAAHAYVNELVKHHRYVRDIY